MKLLKKVFVLISIFLMYLVIKEAVQFFYFAFNLNLYLGYLAVVLVLVFITYFILIPLIKIIRIPRVRGPVKEKSKEMELITERMNRFKKNEIVKSEIDNNPEISFDSENYDKVVGILKKKCFLIRKRYVASLFYSTALFQNGFLDSIAILSASVGLVKDTFKLYNGRVSNKDLLVIAKKVYYSIAIGGSEAIEIATGEVITSFVKGTPLLEKISTSVADGFVNAVLLTRISLITENYCTKTYIEKDKDLYPSPTTIIKAASMITSDMISRIRKDYIVAGVGKVVSGATDLKDQTVDAFKAGGDFVKQKSSDIVKKSTQVVSHSAKSLFQKKNKNALK